MGNVVVSTGIQIPLWPEGVSDIRCPAQGETILILSPLLLEPEVKCEISGIGSRVGSKESGSGDVASEQMKHEESHGIISSPLKLLK